MMWQVSRQAAYGFRALLEIATFPAGTRVQTRDIALRQDIPESYLVKIVSRLAQAELLYTYRGSGGGVMLARDAGQISALDVIQALEGGICFNTCSRDPSRCDRSPQCLACPLWVGLQEATEAYLGSITLSDLAQASEPCT